MFLKHYAGCSDRRMVELLKGKIDGELGKLEKGHGL